MSNNLPVTDEKAEEACPSWMLMCDPLMMQYANGVVPKEVAGFVYDAKRPSPRDLAF